MKKIVLDMQSRIYAKQMERALLQELENWQVIISGQPDMTADICKTYSPQALLMEVTCYSPWMLSQRLAIGEILRRQNPDCKLILSVEERADKKLAAGVKRARRDGLIDEFVFLSMTDKFLPALLDTF